MNDQLNLRAPDAAFEDPLWVRASAAGLRPSLGEIGLQQFAPYLINSVSLSWNTHLADALKAHDMTTTKMRALAILSISSPVTINELSLYALTEQSTMSRTLDSLEEQGLHPAPSARRRPAGARRRDHAGRARRLRKGLADDVRYAAEDVRGQSTTRNTRRSRRRCTR